MNPALFAALAHCAERVHATEKARAAWRAQRDCDGGALRAVFSDACRDEAAAFDTLRVVLVDLPPGVEVSVSLFEAWASAVVETERAFGRFECEGRYQAWRDAKARESAAFTALRAAVVAAQKEGEHERSEE